MSALDIAIKLITKWEGCKLEAYQDEKGIWTIGIGTTGSWVKRGVKITQEKAEELLKERVFPYPYSSQANENISAERNSIICCGRAKSGIW